MVATRFNLSSISLLIFACKPSFVRIDLVPSPQADPPGSLALKAQCLATLNPAKHPKISLLLAALRRVVVN